MIDRNVQIELYAKYAVYAYSIDPISKKADFTAPARVIALVTSESIAEAIIKACGNNDVFFCELDEIERVDIDTTPLPFS